MATGGWRVRKAGTGQTDDCRGPAVGPYAVAPALPAQTAQKGLRLRKFCVWGVMQWKERGPRVGLSVRPSSAASCDGALGRSFHPTGPCWPRRGAGSAGCTRGHMGAVHAGAWCPRRGRTSCGRQSTSRGDPTAGAPHPRSWRLARSPRAGRPAQAYLGRNVTGSMQGAEVPS